MTGQTAFLRTPNFAPLTLASEGTFKKIMKPWFAFVMLLILLSLGCSSARYAAGEIQRDEGSLSYDEVADQPSSEADLSGLDAPQVIDRKIISSALLTLAVAQPDSTNRDLARIAERYEGYASQLGTYRSVIRVKSTHLDEALLAVRALGKVRSQRLGSQDVTDQYFDYQIRLENAQQARERYLELLAQAETVEAALKVERELERLNQTIDLLKGKINRIDQLAALATITVDLRERKKPGPIGYIGVGLYEMVKWLFVRN